MSPKDQRAGKQKTCGHSNLPTTAKRRDQGEIAPLSFCRGLETLSNQFETRL